MAFWWGIELHHFPVSTLSCQWVVPIHVLNSRSLIVLPCVVAHCELIPSYRCWHQLSLPLTSGFLKHWSYIQQQYPQFWNLFFCLPIFGFLAKASLTLWQNSLAMCWIHCQRFLLYISGLENSPGGGETTFDVIVRIFRGDKACWIIENFYSQGPGIQNAFYFCNYSQERFIIQALSMCFQKWSQNDSCCHSQTWPTWLAKGGFVCHLIQSPPCSSRKGWIFVSYIFIYAFFNYCSSPMKLLPLSE